MKTDLVEIFQTIRASVQPYATRGYTVHENSETGYDLYSEKNIQYDDIKVTERFFVGLYINGSEVELKLNSKDFAFKNQALISFGDDKLGLKISELDEAKLKEIETLVEILHIHFKENEWI